MRIYVAGPMRGLPQFNFPAFDHAVERLRSEGHEVFSPAEQDRELYGSDVHEHPERLAGLDVARVLFKSDTAWICENADAIALLPGWEKSKGATAEKALAEAIGLPVYYLMAGYLQ